MTGPEEQIKMGVETTANKIEVLISNGIGNGSNVLMMEALVNAVEELSEREMEKHTEQISKRSCKTKSHSFWTSRGS